MCTVPLSDRAKQAVKIIALAILMLIATLITGCADKPYIAVPECEIVTPPSPGRYVEAMPDEQLVMMTDVYIAQVRTVTECNINIKAMNVRNKTSEPK